MFLGFSILQLFCITIYATFNVNSLVAVVLVVDVIVIVNLITLLSIYMLGNLPLSKTVGGIRLSKEKEIHPIL
jgi:hypothetical protein